MANQIAYEALTVSTTAVGPTKATVTQLAKAAVFYLQPATGAVRHRADGTAPTSAVGLPIEPGGHWVVVGNGNILNALFIRRDSTNGTLHCFYYDAVDIVAIDPLGAGGIYGLPVQGPAASDAVEAGNPVQIGGSVDNTSPAAVAEGDVRRYRASPAGRFLTSLFTATSTPVDALANASAQMSAVNDADSTFGVILGVTPRLYAPDGAWDLIRSAMDAAPGLGALNVAPIGGGVGLRVAAGIGGTSGTSTAVDNLGWVKSFFVRMSVSVVPTGGTPTLDVYIQTQTDAGNWQDIAHFAQVTTATSAQLLSWEGPHGLGSGIGAEGVPITIDRFFAVEDAALAASTVRLTPLGNSLRVKWVFVAGGSTGDYTLEVRGDFHS